jgi:hypothetical protein
MRPSPVGVHDWVSTDSVPTSGVRLSGRPGSSRPVSGHLVGSSGIRRSGRLVSARPASGRLVSTRLSGHLRLVRGSPGVASEVTSVRRATVTTRTDRAAGGLRCPSGSVDGPSRPGGATRRRSCGGGRGSVGRGSGRVVLGRRLRPRSTADGQGPARREGRRWLPATPRDGSVGCSVRFLHLRVAASLAWTRDYAGWSLSSLTTEWTGLEGLTSSTVRMRRGPSAAQPESERARFGADDAVSCENGGGRDRV